MTPKNALVMGLGRFGGGLGVTRHLLELGVRVTISDTASEHSLRRSLEELGSHTNLRVVLGPHSSELLTGIDMLVVNPAVPKPWSNPFINEARSRGIRVCTEIELGYRQLDHRRVIAITGSVGKSTTSAMVSHALQCCGVQSFLAGNIGGSLLNAQISSIDQDPIAVIELSSAMIHWLWGRDSQLQVQPPHVACLTSYAPNHIDWHGSESHYKDSKRRLLEVIHEDGYVIIPDALKDWGISCDATVSVVPEENGISGCTVMGRHNAMNAACAAACIEAMCPELDSGTVVDAIRSFPGLPHRLNRCHTESGIVWMNDSKSTTPEATTLAIDSLLTDFKATQIHLIAGGYDKGIDLSPIRSRAPSLAGLYAIGDTAHDLVSPKHSNAQECKTLEAAVRAAAMRVVPGDVVLLSPGCASWDQFDNYEQRGDLFVDLARSAMKRKTPCSSN